MSAHDRHELGAIEQELIASAPQLAAMLATFARLTIGEPMPGSERIQDLDRPARMQAAFGLVPARATSRRTRGASPPARRLRLSWQAVVVVWLVICAALITVAVMLSHNAGNETCAPWLDACATHVPAHPQVG